MVQSKRSETVYSIIAITAVILGIYFSSYYAYVLFHGLVEVVSIAIAFAMFILVWNTREYMSNNYLRLLGIGYAFSALIDLFHTFAFQGMTVFTGYGANLAPQLWLAARYLQTVTLVAAPLVITRALGNRLIFGAYAAAAALLLTMVYTGHFPDCLVEGKGLTLFKRNSEYVISGFLVISLYLLSRKRGHFSDRTFWLLFASVSCTIVSELCFTAFVSMYDFPNKLGHIAKLTAFYLLYRAILVTGLKEPFELIFRDRKQAEDELVRQQGFSRALLESMADGVVACDGEGVLTLFNRTAREWHGMDPMTLPPEEWAQHYDLFHPDGTTPLSADEVPLARALNGENVADAGMSIVAKGRAARFILANGGLIRDERGKKLGAVVVMRDITELRRAEEALRKGKEELELVVAGRTAELKTLLERLSTELDERTRVGKALRASEERLVEAQRIAHVGNWELDLQTNILTWSDEIFRIFEIDRERFGASYEAFLAAIHPEDREPVNAAYTQSLKLRKPYAIVHRLLMPDGRTKYVQEQCETSFSPEGKPLRSIGIVQDITERKRAEEDIRLNLIQQEALLHLYKEMADAPVREIVSFVVDTCVSLTGSAIGFVGLISDDDRHMEAHLWSAKAMENCPLDKPLNFTISEAGLWAEPIRQRRRMIVNDYGEPNPLKKGYPKGHLELLRFMGVPVVEKGRVVAVAGVANKREDYAETDQFKVSLLLEGMWDLLKRRQAEEALRNLNEELEQRVTKRTAELEQKNRELEKMNKLFVNRELRMKELKDTIKELKKSA